MPSLSYRIDRCIRICVWSTAASLVAIPLFPSREQAEEHPAHLPFLMSVGFALLLSLVFVCVWEPLKERIQNRIFTPHAHGHAVGIAPLLVAVGLGIILVGVHNLMHHFFQTRSTEALGIFLERATIVFLACCCWFTPPTRIPLTVIFLLLLAANIMFVGDLLQQIGWAQSPWTNSEIFYTLLACVPIAIRGQSKIGDEKANLEPEKCILFYAGFMLVLALAAYVIDAALRHFFGWGLPNLLIYSSDVEDAHDWRTTLIDDGFFYGGWYFGALITSFSDDHPQPAY